MNITVAARNIVDSLFKLLSTIFVPKDCTESQWTGLSENLACESFVLIKAVIDTHSKAREHDGDESLRH
jgi:hypothetical protein